MQVVANHIGKRFLHTWVFKDLHFSLNPGSVSAVTGNNGSGKSTLLLIVAGYMKPSLGSLIWVKDGEKCDPATLCHNISLASPRLELIEELLIEEQIRFHMKFKAIAANNTPESLIELSGLKKHAKKTIRQFSSGMKQRLKLLLAMGFESDMLLLDEPCTNLDAIGVQWYQEMLKEFGGKRTILVASNNNPLEYPGYTNTIQLQGGSQ